MDEYFKQKLLEKEKQIQFMKQNCPSKEQTTELENRC
jgi:hypothetical protein